MQDADRDARLERIRKLLAKAERAGSEGEAQLYNDKAWELIARHGIDAALLAEGGAVADRLGQRRIAMHGPYTPGKARLLGWTASAMGLRWLMHGAARGTVGAVTIFGFESDLERAELLYTSLLLQATRDMGRLRGAGGEQSQSLTAYRRSWLYGFAARVHLRIAAAEAKAAETVGDEQPGTGVDVVLRDRKDQVALAFVEKFGALPRARRPTTSGNGYAAGAEAGERADLGMTASVQNHGRKALP